MLDQNDRPKPWTILESKTRVKDKWINLRTDKCQATNGDIVEPYHVLEYGNWVNVVPFCADSMELILVDEYRHGIGMPVLGLCGGAVDKEDGTDPQIAAEAAAIREMREETGHQVSLAACVLKSMPNPALQNNWVYCFVAFDAQNVGAPSFDEGHGEFCVTVKRNLIDVLTQISSGELQMPAMHVAALWSAAQFILKSDTLPQSAVPLRDDLKRYLLG